MLHTLVADAEKRLQDQRVIVHCHAGVGRTAVALSCMVLVLAGLSAADAINHVKHNMTSEQKSIIKKYADFRTLL